MTAAPARWLERLAGARIAAPVWAIVAVGFATLALAFSSRASIGLVMPALEAEFGATRSLISAAAALGLGVMAVLAVASGWLADRFGPARVLPVGLACLALCLLALSQAPSAYAVVAIYSILGGIAFGTAAMQVVAAMVTRAVTQGRGFVMGLAASGSTAGQIFIIPGLAALIAAVGWRAGYAMLGLVVAAMAIATWRLLARLGPTGSGSMPGPGPASAQPRSDADAGQGFLRSFAFQALFWSYVICGFTTSGVIETHLIPYAIACGFTEIQGATAYGLLSFVNFLGITLAGWLSDRVEKHWLLAAIYTLRALSFLLLMRIVGDYPALLAFAVVFGVADYATIPITIGLLAQYLGVARMGMTMGLLAAGHSLGGAAGALMGGVLFDLFASYAATWIAAVVLAQAAAVLVLAVRYFAPRRAGAAA